MKHTAHPTGKSHPAAARALSAAALALLGLCAMATAHAGPTGAAVVVQSGPLQVQYTQAPPPPRHEAVPHARRGMAWVPGHWEWRGHRHVWMSGYWVKARPGYHYRPVQWQERDGRWHMQPGGWDRDGDGVPNRHDRRPDNGHRY